MHAHCVPSGFGSVRGPIKLHESVRLPVAAATIVSLTSDGLDT